MTAAMCLAFVPTLLLLHRFQCVLSLAVPRSLLRNRRRYDSRHHHGSQQFHSFRSSFEEGESTTTVAVVSDNDNSNGEQYEIHWARAPSTMVPLSQPPLLLLQSSTPIISRDACSLLSQYFDYRKNNDGADNAFYHCLDKSQMHMAEALLNNIHDVIDEVTNCPKHDGEVLVPNYVCYESTAIDKTLLRDPQRFGNTLLPDGLHVDTNNGKLFRHLTAILYLTDNQDGFSIEESYGTTDNGQSSSMMENAFIAGGGTSFPLAVPFNENNGVLQHQHNNLRDVAKRLLERDIYHTKGDINESPVSNGRTLEKAALDIFHRDNMNALSGISGRYNYRFGNMRYDGGRGVRVMPEAGKLIYFHNVDDNGMADPMSFHGGEELLITVLSTLQQHHGNSDESPRMAAVNITKSILVFFKEIPLLSFRDRGREGFAEEAGKSRMWTKNMYY